ncbi:glycosyltransferase family 2 protein [Leucothrix mucor]|uniref:glycosyltransferase family 2 protein n=1 Tax=Leucothrix mucor TaxID=45248 RepID=UPI0003FBBFC4|nr:glycosyltransferase family 2 protein [Leucothrix mucor]
MNSATSQIKKFFRKEIEFKEKTKHNDLGKISVDFFITKNKQSIKKNNWYMLELVASSTNNNKKIVNLILNKGLHNEQDISLSFYNQRTRKRLFLSSGNPQKISLVSEEKNFNVDSLSIFQVSFFFALTRTLKKLINNHPLYFNRKALITFGKVYLTSIKEKQSISAILYKKYNEIVDPPNFNETELYSLWISNNEQKKNKHLTPTGFSFSRNKFDIQEPPKNNSNTIIAYSVYSHATQRETFPNLFNNTKNIDYIIIIENGSTLAEDALIVLSDMISANPNAKLIYSDNDYLNSSGFRHSPHFKPDWNPDLFYSSNYIGNSYIIRSDFFRSAISDSELQKLTAYQVLYKITSQLDGADIVHIPKILFHKPDQQKEDISRINFSDVIYPYTEKNYKISIIIPTRDKVELLDRCIQSIIQKSTYKNYEIIIVNNDSKEKRTLDFLSSIDQLPNISVISYKRPFNFSAMNNYAVKKAKGDIILLLNNDTEVISNTWLNELLRYAIHPNVGCVGAKLIYADHTIQHAGIILGINGVAGHAHRGQNMKSNGYFNRLNQVQNFSAMTAACLMVRKDTYLQAGGLTERLAISMNDVDFCLKIKELGYRNIWTPHALLYHHESQSRGTAVNAKVKRITNKEVRYIKHKWWYFLQKDPAYNQNLTRILEDFSINPYQSD